MDFVGDCEVSTDHLTRSIKDPPSVRISNTFIPFTLPKKCELSLQEKELQQKYPMFSDLNNEQLRALSYHTFTVMISTISFTRVSIEEKLINLGSNGAGVNCINCNLSTVTLNECSVQSHDNASIFAFTSKVYMTRCISIESTTGLRVASPTGEAYLTECFISKTKNKGIDMCRDSKYLELTRCVIGDCWQQGVLLWHGAKSAKITDCHFYSNGWKMPQGHCNILFECENIDIRNTKVTSSRGTGLVFEAGCNGYLENLMVSDSSFCGINIGVCEDVTIKNCTINNCRDGILLSGNKYSGTVTIDNVKFNNCKYEIYSDKVGQKVKFEQKSDAKKYHIGFADTKEYEVKKGKDMLDLRKARRKGELDKATTMYYSNRGCGFCGKTLEDLGLKKFMVCGACKVEQYCSKICQTKAWKNHKPRCNHLRECQAKAKELLRNEKS